MTSRIRLRPDAVARSPNGFHTTCAGHWHDVRTDVTTDAYAHDQEAVNVERVHRFLRPLMDRLGAQDAVDIGCGIGTMVAELQVLGHDAWGVDLPGLEPRWHAAGRDPERFVSIDPDRFALPFESGCCDFVFSIGAMEHVGTTDGHADRRPDYRALRSAWARELLRLVRPGGHLLLAGPNRNFPIDLAHGGDSRAGASERWLSARVGATVHRVIGEHFLWSHGDVRRALAGERFRMTALNVAELLRFSRVPAALRPIARAWTHALPGPLRATGLNPWVVALIERR